MKHLLLIVLIPFTAFAQPAPDPAVEGPRIISEAFAKLSGALGEASGNKG